MNKAHEPEMVLTCVNRVTEYLPGQAAHAGFKRGGIKKSHSRSSAGGLGAALRERTGGCWREAAVGQPPRPLRLANLHIPQLLNRAPGTSPPLIT